MLLQIAALVSHATSPAALRTHRDRGPRIVGLRLMPAAYRHGPALALPDAVMARPTGVGRAISTYTIPIEGRDEWLAAARRPA